MTHWPFEVVEKDGSPLIRVQYLGDEKTFSPQEISSMVLSKMKEISEAKLGKTVKKAVVTWVIRSTFQLTDWSFLSVFLPTSMIPNVLPPRTRVPLPVLMFFVSSTNLQQPPSPMVSIVNPKLRRMS